MRYKSAGINGTLPDRTITYLANGASEGNRNTELFQASCQLRDSGVSLEKALETLTVRAIADGLSEKEAHDTIQSAFSRVSRGLPSQVRSDGLTLVDNDSQRTGGFPCKPLVLPESIKGGFLELLQACFYSEDIVAISPGIENEDGQVVPKRGTTLTANEWRGWVNTKGGIDKVFTTARGLFIRINPIRKGGSTNQDVVSFRHVLVEFDEDSQHQKIAKEVQFGTIVASGLPVAAVIDSGNKSLHAWIRVNAPDENEYRRRVKVIWEWLENVNIDKQNKNPSRLSRCPDGWRTVNGQKIQQQLLAVNLGAKSWAEWEAKHQSDGLPKIVLGSQFMAATQPEPSQIIKGLLHQGCKMLIGGASKARKTWTFIDLMLSVSGGLNWWGFPTQQGRVLYINFELPDFALQNRLKNIAHSKGLSDYSGFDLWNLRGYATDFSILIPKILQRIHETNYTLIILDPIYKGLGRRDENKAGDIASLCNEIEQLAVKTGAAVVFGAHYAKGNQVGKDALDRIGGSGVFARDPDVIVTMTQHKERDAYVIDLTLRALPQVAPFVVRWGNALFERDEHADVSSIRKPGKQAKEPRKTTYRRGSIADRYQSMFEHMPPCFHSHPQKGESAVLQHITKTLEAQGEECDISKARRIFDGLRNRAYEVIIFRNGYWQGRHYEISNCTSS